MIGLLGPHGSGKTTLARAYGEYARIPIVETQTSRLWADMGLDPKVEHPFPVRLHFQERVLVALVDAYCSAGVAFISDRTPLDALAYTMADVHNDNVQGREWLRLKNYTDACFRVTNQHFTNLVLVQPGIPLRDKVGSVAVNEAYIEKLNMLMLGFLADPRLQTSHYYIPKPVLALDRRIACVEYAQRTAVKRHLDKMDLLRQQGAVCH